VRAGDADGVEHAGGEAGQARQRMRQPGEFGATDAGSVKRDRAKPGEPVAQRIPGVELAPHTHDEQKVRPVSLHGYARA
jgi:hypothetical protein